MADANPIPIEVRPDWDLFIGGERSRPVDGAALDVANPATGERLATVAQAGPADLERAVAGAADAFASGSWATMAATQRGKVLLRAAELIRERAGEFAW